MKAYVDQDTCISCGLCVAMVGEVFQMNDAGKAEACQETNEQNEAAVQTAIDSCPVAAITWE